MPHERLKPNWFMDEKLIKKLKEILPEAFADGKINWESLKESFGEYIEDEDVNAEHFGLFWPGKKEARKRTSLPTRKTFVRAKGEGIDEENTENIFIEGDNLDVLKLLQKSYSSKIKMIYIDPPYNTGNDFIYDDNFAETQSDYLKKIGQLDELGKSLSTNTKSDGRFHSKWLSMMYPRLKLARNLLSDDGIIFISIDDNEVHHLRLMAGEIFGEENFIAQLVWKKKYTGGKHSKFYADMHEYILVYAKKIDCIDGVDIDRPEDEKLKFENEDEYLNERGKFYTRPLKSNLEERKTLVYPISLPNGKKITTQWLVAPSTFEQLKKEGRIEFRKKKDGEFQVYKKYYEKDNAGKVKPPSIIENIYNNDAKSELKELFGVDEGRDNIFYTVKPTELIKELLKTQSNDCFVLDFFSGAATTADAVLSQNAIDNGKRKFICVQIAELCDVDSAAYKKGLKTIADISKERIRKAIKRIKADEKTLFNKETGIDLGFKVYKCKETNFKQWSDYQGSDLHEAENIFENVIENIKKEVKNEDLIIEIMLHEGFPLDSKIDIIDKNKNTIYRISSPYCETSILISLDKQIMKDTLTEFKLKENEIFICFDNALSDADKVKLSDKGMLKTI